MKYQIAIYDLAGESLRFHRDGYQIVNFDSLQAAEHEAKNISSLVSHEGREIVVLTVHGGFKTKMEYPTPVRQTKRLDLGESSSEAAKPSA